MEHSVQHFQFYTNIIKLKPVDSFFLGHSKSDSENG